MSDEQQGGGGIEPEPSGVPPAGVPSKDARTMALLAHLLGIVLSFIGPLIIWLIKKEEDPFIEDQAKEALNWQITILIGQIISGILMMVCIGVVTSLILFVLTVIFGIIGAMKANDGIQYRYPWALRLIK